MPRDEFPQGTLHRCSFCGKRENQARLIAGPGVYICSDCVQTCCDLLKEDEYTSDMPERLPTPAEMKTYMDGYIVGQEDAKKVLEKDKALSEEMNK